jgi:hypothetical protein
MRNGGQALEKASAMLGEPISTEEGIETQILRLNLNGEGPPETVVATKYDARFTTTPYPSFAFVFEPPATPRGRWLYRGFFRVRKWIPPNAFVALRGKRARGVSQDWLFTEITQGWGAWFLTTKAYLIGLDENGVFVALAFPSTEFNADPKPGKWLAFEETAQLENFSKVDGADALDIRWTTRFGARGDWDERTSKWTPTTWLLTKTRSSRWVRSHGATTFVLDRDKSSFTDEDMRCVGKFSWDDVEARASGSDEDSPDSEPANAEQPEDERCAWARRFRFVTDREWALLRARALRSNAIMPSAFQEFLDGRASHDVGDRKTPRPRSTRPSN